MSLIINPFVHAPLWTPAEITTPAWFDADDASTITESGGLVSQWNDKTGNGKNLTSSGTNQPTLNTADSEYANLDTISFADNANAALQEWLASNGTDTWLWYEVFMVGHSPDMSNSSRPTVFGDLAKTGEGYVVQFDNDTPQDPTPEGWVGGTFYVNGKTTSAAADAALANSPCIIRKYATLGTANKILIGSDRKVANRGWTGKVAEVLVVTAPSAADVRKIEGYLAWKWGLQGLLPAAHQYKSAPPRILS